MMNTLRPSEHQWLDQSLWKLRVRDSTRRKEKELITLNLELFPKWHHATGSGKRECATATVPEPRRIPWVLIDGFEIDCKNQLLGNARTALSILTYKFKACLKPIYGSGVSPSSRVYLEACSKERAEMLLTLQGIMIWREFILVFFYIIFLN